MAKTTDLQSLPTRREDLAGLEYMAAFLERFSFADAEQAYKRAKNDLSAVHSPDLEMEAVLMRERMLNTRKGELMDLHVRETREFHLLHAHVLKHLLKNPENGIPETVDIAELRTIDGEELTTVINGMHKLQDQRRKLLSG